MDRHGEDKMTETAMATGIETRLTTYINALNSGSSDHHHFAPVRGRKYIKVVDSRPTDGGPLATGSVHAFVEIATGDVYKPAGWQAPAKHVRFRLMDDASYTSLLRLAASRDAYSGGYLYL
jgi:hypothetical protein